MRPSAPELSGQAMLPCSDSVASLPPRPFDDQNFKARDETCLRGKAATRSSANRDRLFSGFLISYVLTACSFSLAGYLWGRPGFDLVVVGMGWPHVIFGFLFNVTKRGEAGHQYRIALLYLLVATIVMCYLTSFRLLAGIVYRYFIFHAFRDEIFIFHQRLTGFRFAGPVFDGNGIALLICTVAAVLFGQIPAPGAAGRLHVFLGQCFLAGFLISLTYFSMAEGMARQKHRIPLCHMCSTAAHCGGDDHESRSYARFD